MKIEIKKILGTIAFLMMLSFGFAQTAPPPNGGATGSGGTTPVGGGAPIAGGVLILVSASLAYGLSKTNYFAKQKKL